MRLLILNWRDLRHPLAGGSEVYAQHLARCWAAAGHDVTFFCGGAPGLLPEEHRDGYRIVRRGGRLTVYREARRFFERGGVTYDGVLEVVNTRPFFAPRWVRGAAVATLIHQVADDVWRYEVPLPAALLGRHALEPMWLRRYRSSPVLTISESSRRSLQRYGLGEIDIVPVGCEPPLERPIPPKASTPTLIFVGRLAPNKRPADAVSSHAIVREQLPEAELWVVGDGPQAAHLRAAAGAGVTFFGRVGAAEKQDLVAQAHALVATSVREGWGMTVSEAAHVGTRAIAYDVAGLRDSVPKASGVLTAPNPKALAGEALRMLPSLMAEGRPDLGAAGVVPWPAVADAVLTHLEGGRIPEP